MGVGVTAYVAAAWYLWAHQRELIFLPTRDVARTPADLQLAYEDARIPVGRADSSFVNGWWLPSDDRTAPVLLYLHGNDQNLGANVDAVARLSRMGFSVLAIDYRGYGRSGGDFPSEAQVYEDADAAWTYLIAQKKADPANTLLYGHSLGAAIALELAVRRPQVAGVIAEATFTSLSAIAGQSYWMFPTDWLLDQRFDALANARRLRVPVLFIHGTADTEVPYAMSEQLYAATPGTKRLTLIPGGGHENSGAVGGEQYARAVLEFVEKTRRAPRRGSETSFDTRPLRGASLRVASGTQASFR